MLMLIADAIFLNPNFRNKNTAIHSIAKINKDLRRKYTFSFESSGFDCDSTGMYRDKKIDETNHTIKLIHKSLDSLTYLMQVKKTSTAPIEKMKHRPACLL